MKALVLTVVERLHAAGYGRMYTKMPATAVEVGPCTEPGTPTHSGRHLAACKPHDQSDNFYKVCSAWAQRHRSRSYLHGCDTQLRM